MVDMDLETLCARVYFDRLDKADQSRVTDEQCRTRGAGYRAVVLATVKILGVELAPSAPVIAGDYDDLC